MGSTTYTGSSTGDMWAATGPAVVGHGVIHGRPQACVASHLRAGRSSAAERRTPAHDAVAWRFSAGALVGEYRVACGASLRRWLIKQWCQQDTTSHWHHRAMYPVGAPRVAGAGDAAVLALRAADLAAAAAHHAAAATEHLGAAVGGLGGAWRNERR